MPPLLSPIKFIALIKKQNKKKHVALNLAISSSHGKIGDR